MTNQSNSPIVFQFQSNDIRVTQIQGDPWFCLRDVCDVLSVQNVSDVVSKQLDSKGVDKIYTLTDGGKQQVTFVSEPNLYRVIFRSNKPEAKTFQDWVFNEVLPSIRKTGSYSVTDRIDHAYVQASMNTFFKMHEWLVQNHDIKPELAACVTIGRIEKDTGVPFKDERLLLPSPEKICNLNQTQLGQMMGGLSAKNIGRQLRDLGLMYDDIDGNRVLTDKGHQYGEMYYYSNPISGHTGTEIRWSEDVLHLLKGRGH